jgi:hypothetical protein
MPPELPSTMPLRSRITCPHCWHHFSPDECCWISQHQDLLGDPRLGKEHNLRFLPTRFTVEGHAIDAKGMACHGLACPRCHLTLPWPLLEQAPLFLSILGSPASGKSYFLAAMTWQLRRALKEYFCLSFGDADPASNFVLNQYEELLFLNPEPDELVAIQKTELQGALYDNVKMNDQDVDYPRPFVFSLKPSPGHLNSQNSERVSRTVCLYDNAGEHFQPGQDTARSPGTRHLALSRALLFLFDPTQDPRFRKACEGRTSDPQMHGKSFTYRQETVLSEAADRVRRHSGIAPGAKHNRPLIVVVTKYDSWSSLLDRDRLGMDQVLRESRASHRALDVDAIARVSAQVRTVLETNAPEIVVAAEGFSERVVYLPVSALGGAPMAHPKSGALCVRPRDVSPLWVEIPIIYALLLTVPGLIPYTRQAANPPHGGSVARFPDPSSTPDSSASGLKVWKETGT